MHNGNWLEFFIGWLVSMLAAGTIVGARIGQWLYGATSPLPPENATLYRHWRRRRTWIILSELSSLPAFATIALCATIYWGLELWFAIPIAMLLAIVGFLLLLDGVQRMFRRRFDIVERLDDNP